MSVLWSFIVPVDDTEYFIAWRVKKTKKKRKKKAQLLEFYFERNDIFHRKEISFTVHRAKIINFLCKYFS